MTVMRAKNLVAAFVALAWPLAAQAQAPYPSQSIRLIVPYAPGGLPDTVARITGQHLQERIGQTVVVENRAGGGAAAAVSALMGAPADGYTFIVTDGSIVSANPSLAGAVESKKVKLLANNSSGRWFQAPDVPPLSEVVPGYDFMTIVGLYARPDIPQPVLDKITAEATAAVKTPEARKQFAA